MDSSDAVAALRHPSDSKLPRDPNILTRVWAKLVGLAIPIVIIALIYWSQVVQPYIRWWQAFFKTPLGWYLCALIAVGGILYFVLSVLTNRYRLAKVRALGRADVVFLFSTSRVFRTGMLRFLRDQPLLRESDRCAASATSTGIVIWLGNPYRKVVGLLWSSVQSVDVDVVLYGRSLRAAVRIEYTDQFGTGGSLALVSANPDLLPTRSSAEVAWVAAELNRLRASGPTAKVL